MQQFMALNRESAGLLRQQNCNFAVTFTLSELAKL
jgi:hypothetical protein